MNIKKRAQAADGGNYSTQPPSARAKNISAIVYSSLYRLTVRKVIRGLERSAETSVRCNRRMESYSKR